MAKRPISIVEEVAQLLNNYESTLQKAGYTSVFIDTVARDLFELVFVRVSEGSFSYGPQYVGIDPHFPGHSQYAFTHGTLYGKYASIGDHVILLEVKVLTPTSTVQTQVSAA